MTAATSAAAQSLVLDIPQALGIWPHLGALNIASLRTSIDDAVVADLHSTC